MVNVRKPIIENPVYCEILFRLGAKKQYVNEFVNHFTKGDDMDGTFEGDNNLTKKQPVLARQMDFLRKEGYLLYTNKNEKGNKLKGNIKLYYVNMDKIIESFLNYYIYFIKENIDKGKTEGNNLKKISKSYVETCKKNKVIKYLFTHLIEEPRHINELNLKVYTLKDLFYMLIISLGNYRDKIRDNMQAEVKEQKGINIVVPFLVDLKDDIKFTRKELRSDYEFFREDFLFTISYNSFLFSQLMDSIPMKISHFLLNKISDEEREYYNINF
jgi:hypothetical protein